MADASVETPGSETDLPRVLIADDQALVRSGFRMIVETRSDLEGVYLETATEANVAYYTRNGFEVIGEFHPLGVRMWRMFQARRDAGAPSR